MKRFRIEQNLTEEQKEAVFGMSKITRKHADTSRTGDIPDYIYFSPSKAGHGPRIKFHGGTRETADSENAPSYSFSVNGPDKVILQRFMNKQNCPNAFDSEYLHKIEQFIINTLPILLLVWFRHLDESEALLYFQGSIAWTAMLHEVEDVEDDILACLSIVQLHKYCIEHNLYTF